MWYLLLILAIWLTSSGLTAGTRLSKAACRGGTSICVVAVRHWVVEINRAAVAQQLLQSMVS